MTRRARDDRPIIPDTVPITNVPIPVLTPPPEVIQPVPISESVTPQPQVIVPSVTINTILEDQQKETMNAVWYKFFQDLNDSLIDPSFSWVKPVKAAIPRASDVNNLFAGSIFINGPIGHGVGDIIIFPTSEITLDDVTINYSNQDGARLLFQFNYNFSDSAMEVGIWTVSKKLGVHYNNQLTLIRATDYDNNGITSEINLGDIIVVMEGTTNAGSLWRQTGFSNTAGNILRTNTLTFSNVTPGTPLGQGGATAPTALTKMHIQGRLYFQDDATNGPPSIVWLNTNQNSAGVGWVRISNLKNGTYGDITISGNGDIFTVNNIKKNEFLLMGC